MSVNSFLTCMKHDLEKYNPACLVLENGMKFPGFSPAWQQGTHFLGEVVFNTGMTGYPESLTDPSYAGQILTFTYPLIGNYGIPAENHWESSRIFAKGLIVNHASHHWSHHLGERSLQDWLKSQNVPLMTHVDTRELTKVLRNSGTMLGAMTTESHARIDFQKYPARTHWVHEVSVSAKKQYGKGTKKIIAVDCGMKENILRSLLKWPLNIERVPHHYDYTRDEYDGIFISNGPGDPTDCTETISILQKALQREKPIFGICLGAQLMALAAGAKTYKLPFGHRGQNQPCIHLESKHCYITSQNHGYAIDETSISGDWRVTFKNLNDHSVEGIEHKTKPFFAVQFHPEASPGPTDTTWLFEKFYKNL
jgi:carbamoyl-phosphate synthase small subunit